MKKIVSILLFVLLFNFTYAQTDSGSINSIGKSRYQIEYNNQVINIYFDVNPSGDFNDLRGLVLTANEQLAIVSELKDQIDKFPEGFRGKFLGVSIFPLHIDKIYRFGYHFDNQIIVEASKSKLSLSDDMTIGSTLSHEIAHQFLKKMEGRAETIALKSYLTNLRNANPPNFNSENNRYKSGYVSKYAAGVEGFAYDAEEEICETFSYLERPEGDLLNFVNQNPNALLSIKTRKVLEYLYQLDPEFKRYFFVEDITLDYLASNKIDKVKLEKKPKYETSTIEIVTIEEPLDSDFDETYPSQNSTRAYNSAVNSSLKKEKTKKAPNQKMVNAFNTIGLLIVDLLGLDSP